MKFNELYSIRILEHNRSPRNYWELAEYNHSCTGQNPLCGDSVTFFVKVSAQDVLEELSFVGKGCAITKSCASMLTEFARGKTIQELEELCGRFDTWLTSDSSKRDDYTSTFIHHFGDYEKLKENVARIPCATLPWETLKNTFSNPVGQKGDENLPEELDVAVDDAMDLTGVVCPINFVKVKVKMSKMHGGSKLSVILDNGEPIENVPRSLELEGHQIISKKTHGDKQTQIIVLKA